VRLRQQVGLHLLLRFRIVPLQREQPHGGGGIRRGTGGQTFEGTQNDDGPVLPNPRHSISPIGLVRNQHLPPQSLRTTSQPTPPACINETTGSFINWKHYDKSTTISSYHPLHPRQLMPTPTPGRSDGLPRAGGGYSGAGAILRMRVTSGTRCMIIAEQV